ncbi:MAG: discoidin domain-containing protein [Acidobacteria bacterium]|nr:discoidin domain-containing protein [Acidobacteriota bacterium]
MNEYEIQDYLELTLTNVHHYNTADEVLSETWTDGAGRVRLNRVPHTFSGGSTATWAGTVTEYDILGRVKRQSVPTEVDANFDPTGDDQTRGWLWTHQRYDWMGRVVRKIATDGDPNALENDSDVLISYAGCGCAGGLETTIQGELVPRTDGTSGNARRKQKVYQDILGRTFKTETYEWDGSTVYSTSTAQFNGRDQVILGRQYAGDTSSTTFQDTTATFDGHGRLRAQHVPQQDANTYTAFEYYPDDRLHTKTDARGAISTMTYDDRGLLTEISSVLPGAPQTPTQRKNFALARNGAIPTASSEHSTAFSRWAAINGDRTGGSWGNAGGWNDGTLNSYPDWLQVEFAETKTIDEINVITLQDNYQTAGEPTENTTFTQEGITSFDVQYWNGSSWATVPNGNVTNNDKVWRKFEFSSVTTSKIRVVVNDSLNFYSRIVELEAWGPGSSPSVNTGAEFAYDAAGNRTSMTDIYGSTTYEYNELSQMTAETRQFTDTLTHAPLPNNSFRLEYEYQLAGALRSLTDPYGDAIYYGNDRAGRLTSVTGSTFGNVTEYASDPGYRAWGGLKSLSYGNGVDMSMTFDDRLRPDFYELRKNSTELIKKSYEYIPDGNLKYVGDLLDGRFDRLQTYDHQGRIKAGKSGAEARGQTVDPAQMETQLPYRQSYEFNQFGNMTARNNLHWGREAWYGQNFNLSYTYQNNRITNQDWQYDADGRVKQSAAPDEWGTYTYDARGLLIRSHAGVNIVDIGRFYDGDGREVKRERTVFVEDEINYPNWPFGYWQVDGPTYYIRSTVLGGEVVSETGPTGKKKKTYVFAAGTKLATQAEYTYNSTTTESVYWHHADASGMSHRTSFTNGTVSHGAGNYDGTPADTDPLGGNMGTSTPYIELIEPPPPSAEFPYFQMHGDDTMYVNGQRVPCTLDGMTFGCSTAMNMLETGSAIPAHLAGWQGIHGFSFQSHGLGIFSTTLPDLFTDNTGRIWSQPHGTRAEGWRIFEGGTSIYSVNWEPGFSRYFQVSDGIPNYKKVEFKGLSEARMAVDHLRSLNGGKCGEMLEKLFQEIGKAGKLRSKTFAELFNAIDHILLNGNNSSFIELVTSVTGHTPSLPGGGGGLAYGYPRDGKYWESGSIAFVTTFASGYSTLRPLSNSRVAGSALINQRLIGALQQNMLRLVHEMLHISVANRSSVSHKMLGNAAKTVDPDILGTGEDPETRGSSELTEFIRKHCTNFVTR